MLSSARVFLKVSELGSFSKAAKVMDMAPSSIARTIDNLEQTLKATLFKRSTRQLQLTQQGEIFLKGAMQLVNDADALVASMNPSVQQPSGQLSISVFESFGRMHICPLIPEFLKRYPDINIKLDLNNQLTDLYESNIDLAIRIGTPNDSSLKARRLMSNHTIICASPDYLAKHPPLNEPSQLAEHNCLLLSNDRQRTYWHFLKDQHKTKVLVAGNFQSKGGTPLLSGALAGVGIVQLANWFVADAIEKGQLVPCLTHWQASLNDTDSGEIYAVYPNTRFPNPNVRLFIDFMVEYLAL
ncbi:LysR family transcriptional regulator [Catenovulum sp. SM1970]|uniref:LysR family transcriptional regulator n=1 Tax=Marinifaba aquimaris TaxID=2741323 RepID=UPI0015731156|nr:LysR family transcriptional regulator [Marinifaba aquimaris]NTS78194.1 LysR family transcriptional regulator [Marinifaba aquimaris]